MFALSPAPSLDPFAAVTNARARPRAVASSMVDDEPVLTGDPHPETWDLICVGTGLAETMLAGCAPILPRPRASAPRHTPSRLRSPRTARPTDPLPPPLPSQRRGQGR